MENVRRGADEGVDQTLKKQRKAIIREIVQRKPMEKQSEIVEELMAHGFRVTQATVSRDIKEMRLIKVATPQGRMIYALPKAAKEGEYVPGKLNRIFSESVVSVMAAENIVVIKTLSGSASPVAETIDSMLWPEIVGTLAGDNTIMVVTQSRGDAQKVVTSLQDLMS
ncbi:MAG: arginine repressor [Clostridia bacterium]|nr:arginine repressor [Clostridia bacterium]